MADWSVRERIFIKKRFYATSKAQSLVVSNKSSLPLNPSSYPVSCKISSILPYSSSCFPFSISNPTLTVNKRSKALAGDTTGTNYNSSQAPLAPATNLNLNPINSNSLNSLSFYYQNVRGLRTKCLELYIPSLACVYDFIVFSETWLNSSIYDSELIYVSNSRLFLKVFVSVIIVIRLRTVFLTII